MIKKLLLFSLFLIAAIQISAQNKPREQYFDGNDTIASKTLQIELYTASTNVWQIGRPQKLIFDSAATLPHALITDTINNVPVNNVSRFYLGLRSSWWNNFGVLAIRWKQKLDMSAKTDGGIIEYSVDSGQTWKNIFYNPEVHNLYGFDTLNRDTILATGEYAFSGTDTVWRDVWLCFKMNFLSVYDSVTIRYTLKTGAIDNNREGWMIDNMMAHSTWVHTVKKKENPDELLVYPTITNGIINIDAATEAVMGDIKDVILLNAEGKVLRRFGASGIRTQVDISGQPNGSYFINIVRGKGTKTFRITLTH